MRDPSVRRSRRQVLFGLQAALLVLDLHGRHIDRADVAPNGATWANVLFRAIQVVVDRFAALRAEWPEGLACVPYWLGPYRASGHGDMVSGGISLIRNRLAAATGHWSSISAELAKKPDLLALLDEWWDTAERGDAAADSLADLAIEDNDQLRVWVPVIHKRSGGGMLIELVIVPDPSHGGEASVAHELKCLRDSFVRGLKHGLLGALVCGREVGVGNDVIERWSHLKVVEVGGLPETIEVEDMSAGLPLAVALFALFLDLPSAPRLVSGPINPHGVVEKALAGEQYEEKRAAVAQFGVELMAFQPRITLLSIGDLLWGEQWQRAMRQSAAQHLAAADHQSALVEDFFAGLVPIVNGRTVRLVQLSLVDVILRRLNNGAQVVVVGGARSTSRTISTRQAAFTWQQKHNNCPVIELRCADGELPDPSTLAHLIDLARLAHDVGEDQRALVLLEGLLPHDGHSNLDEVLPPAARATGTIIVAVCTYVRGGKWIAKHVATALGVAKSEHVKEFCDKLLDENDVHDLRDTTVTIACHTAAGDLSFLTHELLGQSEVFADRGGSRTVVAAAVDAVPSESVDGAVYSAEGDLIAHRRRAYASQLNNGLDDAKQAELRIIASCSLLQVSVSAALLQALTRTDLLRINARRDHLDRWSLANPSASRAILAGDSPDRGHGYGDRQWKRTADVQFDVLSAFFERPDVIQTRVGVEQVVATLVAAAAVEPRLHSRLIKKLKGALIESMSTGSLASSLPPVLIAHMLVVGGVEFTRDDRLGLLRPLLSSIQAMTWAGMSIRDATVCLRALLEHRDYFVPTGGVRAVASPDVSKDNLFVAYQELLSTIRQGLSSRVAQSDPYQTILLLSEMGRFYEEVTSKQILPLVFAATHSCRRHLQRHYESAVKLVELALQYGIQDQSEFDVLAKLANASGIRELLDGEPHRDAGLLLARTALDLVVHRDGRDNEDYRRQVGSDLRATLSAAHTQQATAALALLAKVDLWFARQVVRFADIRAWVRKTLATATPWDAAFLLRTVAHVDVRTVIDVLYRANSPDADTALIDTMAKAVIDMGDIKGSGYVLSAVAFADNVWGPSGESSAASQLCHVLRDFIDEGLSDELRSSVVLAVMSALIEAGCPAETLRSLIDRCATVVQQDIEDNDKDNAPRLALLLGGHDEIGREFLDVLSDRLSDTVLFSRMAGAAKVEARAAFHRLARALGRGRHEALTEQYVDQDWWNSAVGDLRRSDALTGLRAASAYLATARDAGADYTAGDVLGGEADQWAKRLRALKHPDQLAEALNLLRGLSPPFARRCLIELNQQSRSRSRRRPAPRARPAKRMVDLPAAAVPSPARLAKLRQVAGAEPGGPLHGVMDIVSRAFIRTGQAVDLLYAVERIETGAGIDIGRVLAGLDSWQKRAFSVADIENPAQLGQALRKLARLNMDVPSRVFDKIRRRWAPMVGYLRAPSVIQELIRGYAVSTPDGTRFARELIDGMDLYKVGLRLTRGHSRDLRFAAALIRALSVWGTPEQVDKITAVIPTDAMTVLNPGDAAYLLRTISDTTPARVQTHLPAACASVAANVTRARLVDPESHWLGVGWLLRALADHGIAAASVVDPGLAVQQVALCTRDEVVRSWVAAAARCWDGLEIEEALARASSLRSWEFVALALCAAEAGGTDPELFEYLDLANALEFASPTWQIEILRAARSAAVLRETVVTDVGFFGELGRWLLAVGLPEGEALISAAESLTRT
jgi:hypothetical protein